MKKAVYIAICHISKYSGTETKVDIFSTLPEAKRYKARQEAHREVVLCEIYKSYKEEV